MNNNKTVLLIEDNPDILWTNKAKFKACGYNTLTAESLAEARVCLAESAVDAIVLDIMLPDGSGLDFIPEIRGVTTAPVLLLTALTESDDKIAGLKAGGDDYICKPYNINELVARVEAFLRREAMRAETADNRITRGPLSLDIVSGQAYINDKDLMLTPKEFAILRLLAQEAGRRFTADEIYKTVWGLETCDDTRTVQVRISNLRKKISAQNARGIEIELTERKYYSLLIIT